MLLVQHCSSCSDSSQLLLLYPGHPGKLRQLMDRCQDLGCYLSCRDNCLRWLGRFMAVARRPDCTHGSCGTFFVVQLVWRIVHPAGGLRRETYHFAAGTGGVAIPGPGSFEQLVVSFICTSIGRMLATDFLAWNRTCLWRCVFLPLISWEALFCFSNVSFPGVGLWSHSYSLPSLLHLAPKLADCSTRSQPHCDESSACCSEEHFAAGIWHHCYCGNERCSCGCCLSGLWFLRTHSSLWCCSVYQQCGQRGRGLCAIESIWTFAAVCSATSRLMDSTHSNGLLAPLLSGFALAGWRTRKGTGLLGKISTLMIVNEV